MNLQTILTSRWWGFVCAISSPILFALNIPLSVGVFLDEASPWMLAGLLDIGGGLGLALVYILTQKTSSFQSDSLDRAELRSFAIAMLTGGILAPGLFFFSLTETAASSSMLLSVESPFTVLLARLINGECLNLFQMISVILITLSSMILSSDMHLSVYSLSAAGAALMFAISHICTGKIARKNPFHLGMCNLLIAGIVNVCVNLFLSNSFPDMRMVILILISGFLCNGISYVLYILGMEKIGSALTGSIFSLVPVFGTIFLVLLLKEPLTQQIISAGILVLVGMILLLVKSLRVARNTAAQESLNGP